MIAKERLREEMNRLGEERTPFLWAISYDMTRGFVIPRPLGQNEVLWEMDGIGNIPSKEVPETEPDIEIVGPVGEEAYAGMFGKIRKGLLRGDSFLANLTAPTEVRCHGSFGDIFLSSSARFKLLISDEFVCFSPEPFVEISGRDISTFPMKGTADATLPEAERLLLDNYKELCEHCTIVDLMRNDLNSVATEVGVRRFRYIERIVTSSSPILQTSSEICGRLPEETAYRFGDILLPLLPAGSISGAPKQRTLELIDDAEIAPRGWYTGVFGYFDGEVMRSAVMIRCLQRDSAGRTFFHSGGGITINSSEREEYAELLSKVYLSK